MCVRLALRAKCTAMHRHGAVSRSAVAACTSMLIMVRCIDAHREWATKLEKPAGMHKTAHTGSEESTGVPWIKTVHIVSMTHLDIGGWGPGSPECEDQCTYSGDVCNSYFDSFMPLAAATATDLLRMRDNPPSPSGPACPKGPGFDKNPSWYNCPGYTPNNKQGKPFTNKDCEAVGCCVDPTRYHTPTNFTAGWCFPDHSKQANNSKNVSFVYHTHPWIVQEYLNATAGCGKPLSTRNATELAAVEAAIRAGQIAWHAKPFTMIHELCHPDVFAASLNISRDLNARFGVSHGRIAGKITDLPGVSIGIVPLLARAGVKALHIGTNGMGDQVFPSFNGADNLPQVFRWHHPATGDEIVVMNEQGYGTQIVLPAGIGFDQALRWQFTSDNGRPPTAEAVLTFWDEVQGEFPNAKLRASTLDEFAEALYTIKDRLPVVTQEIGNVWLPQMVTDPWRLRALRAISRLRTQWLVSGKLQWNDPDLASYTSRLLVPIEHNFGLDTHKVITDAKHDSLWTNAQFHPVMNDPTIGYPGLTEYSTDRDRYIYPRPPPDTATKGFKDFVALVNTTLAKLILVPTLNTNGLEPVDLRQTLTIENSQLKLEFNASTGAISAMQEKGGTMTQWVAPGDSLGEFVYRTYTQQADINKYCSQLTPGFKPSDANLAWWPWSKPGMDLSILNDTTMPPLADCSRAWPVTLKKAWKTTPDGSPDKDQTMLLQLALPTAAVTLFGGMGEAVGCCGGVRPGQSERLGVGRGDRHRGGGRWAMAEPEPEPELNVDAQAAAETGSGSEQAAVEEGDAPAASTATSAPQRPPTTAATDDASPHKLADAGPPEGKPLDKIIRTELAEEAEGESDEAQGAAAGGDAGLTLELPDGSPDEASATETDLPRVDTPSAGVIHSSLASSPGGKISSSPVQDAVGKVHAVTGDLVATPSAGGAPTLAVVADASDVECETPRGDAATDAAAKTAWPGAEADGDEDEEDEEEDGDAFGEDESGLGEMHAVGKVPVVTRRKRADTGAGGALMDAAAKVLGTGDGK